MGYVTDIFIIDIEFAHCSNRCPTYMVIMEKLVYRAAYNDPTHKSRSYWKVKKYSCARLSGKHRNQLLD